MPSWQRLSLVIVGRESKDHVHERVPGLRAPAEVAAGVAKKLLVLGISVVAEAKLHRMFALRIGDAEDRRVVLSGVVPRSRAGMLLGAVRRAPAHSGKVLRAV